MPNTAIKVSHLTKVYKLYDKPIDRLKESLHPLKKKYHKDFYALNDVSFEIKKGETVGIIGKNGAGKSTLLKIITGVLTPSSGHVHVNGRIASLLELGAGFNPEYTGVENIYLQGTLMGYSHSEMETKIDEILAFADIGDFVYQPVKSYSSGMFARLAFAVAINVEPDILIVDEALSVGDIAFQSKCAIKMQGMKDKGISILLVTHSLSEIKKICTRAIYIKSGEIIKIGNTKEVCNSYESELYGELVANQVDFKEIEKNKSLKNSITPEINLNPFFEENKNISRSGSCEAEIINVEIIVNDNATDNVNVGDLITVRIYVKYYKDIATEGIIGYMFQNEQGQGIIGYNIWNSGKLLPAMKQGSLLVFDFKSTNILAPGDYTISLGIRSDWSPQNLNFMDFIQVAAKVSVLPIKDNYVAGLVYNKHECVYEVFE